MLSRNNDVALLSDGSSSQYKQKKDFFFFCNRIFEKNFKCAAWSFFEKSNGKGAAEGVGAVVTRIADALVAHVADIADVKKLYHSLLSKINVELFYVCNSKTKLQYQQNIAQKFETRK